MAERSDAVGKEELILAVLASAKKVYGKTKLQKLIFLLQEEADSPTFQEVFGFEPYYYGPFSREISRTVSGLERQDLVRIAARPTDRHGDVVIAHDYELTEEGKRVAAQVLEKLPPQASREVRDLIRRYNLESLASLLEYTYKEYPDMAARSTWEGL